MQVSFGPRSDQYRAYVDSQPHKLPPGTTGPVTEVATFYAQTRRRYFPGTFSFISLIAPFGAFAGAIWLIVRVLSSGSPDLLQDAIPLDPKPLNPPIRFDWLCGPDKAYDPLLNGLFASAFHFSVTHVALIAVCALALFAAAASIRNVLETHGYLGQGAWAKALGWIVALGVPAVAGYLVYYVAAAAIGQRILGLFHRLLPVSTELLDKCTVLKPIKPLSEQFFAQMEWGAKAVSVGVVSLVLAAALLGWRFERKDINGAWSDSYVLRHKLNNALTLFFVGSILLVVTTLALSSATDWTGAVLDVVRTATAPESTAAAPASQSGATKAAGPTETAAAADPAAAEFDTLKSLKTSISSFAGALGSLLLILIFVPALYCLAGEIDIAGKTHASFDMASKDPPHPAAKQAAKKTEVVAGWKTVQDWKERHGLKLSFSDLTGTFVAVLAPLLSGSIVDLTKITLG
jgi:hypothetical protein